jgi:glutamate-1-semialdehyde 2,1-aminomutase
MRKIERASRRFHGGISECENVEPDLVTLGKAIGGGVPISAVAENRKIMETMVPGQVSPAGTFNSKPLGVTAGIATLPNVLTRTQDIRGFISHRPDLFV